MANRAGPGPPADDRLRRACRLAVEVARAAEAADPGWVAPSALVPILGFRRLGTAAYQTVARVVDDDEDLRARVAAVADEAAVGRAGWLWLTRPHGWSEDPAWVAGDGSPAAAKRAAKVDGAIDRHRRQAEQAETRRRRLADQLVDARRQAADARRQARELAGRVEHLERLEAERNRAMRTAKALEKDLAETRRELRLVRQANIEAETELATLRAAASAAAFPGDPTGELAALRDAIAEAVEAAAGIGRSLTAAGHVLSCPPSKPGADIRSSPGNDRAAPGAGDRSTRRPGRRRTRRPPALPPGLFEGSAAANRHLLSSGEALVVVDGYNVARAAWSKLDPEEERRRVIALLEAVQARSASQVTVVFDGDSATTAPPASRSVRVQFSATGVTADEDIAALLTQLPQSQAVVVVSSDRQVAADARRRGAAVIGSREFVAAARG